MDRDKLKQSGRRRKNGTQAADGQQATTVAEALGTENLLSLNGKEFTLRPLSFGDLKRITARYGDLQAFTDRLSEMEMEGLSFFLWLMLRKTDESLTEEQTDELLPLNDEELAPIIEKAALASGLVKKGAQPEQPEEMTAEETPESPTGNS